jgi:Na+/H+ antiporter NhaD/arsenite permease-like protein
MLKTIISIVIITLLLLFLFTSLLAKGPSESVPEEQSEGLELGAELPLWSIIPFIGILLSIAIFPLIAGEFWHHHFGKVSAFWALVFAIPFLFAYHGEALYEILHIYITDYIPFIILLWALFTVAGGILVEGTLVGTPLVNTIMLLIGTVMASWVGTTGAAMIMIRPVLRANDFRKKKVHTVVFFIFLVANIGGSLTPLGDPPLYLGFLHYVPFFWTLNLVKPMALLVSLILGLYFLVDTLMYKREKKQALSMAEEEARKLAVPIDAEMAEVQNNPGTHTAGQKQPIRIRGLFNFIFLAGVMGGVLLSGLVNIGDITILGVSTKIQFILREVILILMGLLSLKLTSRKIREANEFDWFPIKEVAYLFAGIFMTIVPALAILRAGEAGHLDFLIRFVKEPAHYFWVTGSLSSFLDNAPTYLTFLNTVLGKFYAGTSLTESQMVADLISKNGVFLLAISTGAVFFGANTYIGNAPNFMVKTIAQSKGVNMPSFFGYMLWSVGILVPFFLIVSWVFF